MASESPQAGLGETIAEARAGGFFRWFCLDAVDDAMVVNENGPAAEGLNWHRFQPSGLPFHDLVELAVRVGGDERITEGCLSIDRTFIGSAAIRPFARDIVKSFLQWILPAEAGSALEPEIEAIGRFCDGESTVIVSSSAIRQAPWLRWRRRRGGDDVPNVFMGSAARAERRIGQTRIVFENVIEGLPSGASSSHATPVRAQNGWLRITVRQPT